MITDSFTVVGLLFMMVPCDVPPTIVTNIIYFDQNKINIKLQVLTN